MNAMKLCAPSDIICQILRLCFPLISTLKKILRYEFFLLFKSNILNILGGSKKISLAIGKFTGCTHYPGVNNKAYNLNASLKKLGKI